MSHLKPTQVIIILSYLKSLNRGIYTIRLCEVLLKL